MHPYRDQPSRPPPEPRWLPAPWWRRLPCLFGRHRWVEVCRPLLKALWAGLHLCVRCGTVGSRPWVLWGGNDLPIRMARPPHRNPPLRCRRCGAVHSAPLLHGCDPRLYEPDDGALMTVLMGNQETTLVTCIGFRPHVGDVVSVAGGKKHRVVHVDRDAVVLEPM